MWQLRSIRIPPEKLSPENWCADLFCQVTIADLADEAVRVELRELAQSILEGWRVSTVQGRAGYDPRIQDAPIYRQANLEPMRFRLDVEHWKPPEVEGSWCVQPGDVVINKIPPLRAALVTSQLPRHPMDGNCILLRSLKEPYGAWIAFCLNQELYADYLIRSSGSAALPRVGLKTLSQMPFALPSYADIAGINHQFWQWNDAALTNAESLYHLSAEVEAYVVSEVQPLQDDGDRLDSSPYHSEKVQAAGSRPSLLPGRFFSSEVINDSWVPSHVQVANWQRQLRHRLGWLPLERLLSSDEISRDRLVDVPERGRYLRLSDVRSDFTFVQPEEEDSVAWRSRVYRKPLTDEEVLLSTLVTSPQIAFVDESPVETTYVTDHLQRLRFKETPGAWALVLKTSPVRAQLAGMAMGTAQQFTHVDAVRQLCLPDVPIELRERWERAIRRHHQRKRELEVEWGETWNQAQRLFDAMHSLTGRRKDG
ncbi:hypothetical protein H6G00_22215 [Leptolyngbya sp. FACHB-541]|uniref:hypothetical protein n=1 Tax=Leptolyngbya sp. FACHB-541 TaxID=2692810 RepID=UPI001681F5FA|nr:hypothetical protein [Leptolyngbya sp. FACHB-541]MBD1999292.1 hypothetical protein [Leptolyngbya sp. FACHB-541]